MTCTQHLTEELRSRGYRITPQRTAILAYLHDTPGHSSPAEIYEHVSQTIRGVTEATVYRTLDFLVGQGLALVAHIGSGRMVYESAVHDHDHLICRKCGDSVEINHQDLVSLFKHFEQTTGFMIDASHVTFFGLCPGCQNSSALSL